MRGSGPPPWPLVHALGVRRLGIDPGTKRVGVAVADEDSSFASPRATLEHRSLQATAAELVRVAVHEEAGEVVVGLPLGLDGREGASSRHARSLAAAISEAAERAKVALSVVLWDERLTSQAAHRALAGVEMSSRDRRGKVDRVAAVLLLEGYLDAVRARRRRSERLGDATSQSLEDDAEAMWHEPVRTAEDRGVPGRGGRRARGPNRP
jgi:putative Holliday junction resolvase